MFALCGFILTENNSIQKDKTRQKKGQNKDIGEMEMALTFSGFLKKLFLYCGDSISEATFVTEALENIIFNRDNDDLQKKVSAFGMDDNDLRKLYNGTKILSATSARYVISHLDVEHFADYVEEKITEDARAFLCNDFELYLGNVTPSDICKKVAGLFGKILREIAEKGKSATGIPPQKVSSNFTVEKELTEIVKTLAKMPISQLKIELTYEPVNVNKKIKADNSFKDEVRYNVINYYRFVENLFKEASKNNSTMFDEIARQVQYAYESFSLQEQDQEMIFDKLVEWLKRKVMYVSDHSCRIIISFFVQNCEVFRATTE